MSRVLLDCESGVSGDMIVAALIDLGADVEVLDKALSSMKVQGFQTKVSRVNKGGIDCCDFDVILDAEHENHDHDMEYLYGHLDHNHEHEHNHNHTHKHDSAEVHRHHHGEHRNLDDVYSIINALDITENARDLAKKIFYILAEAEAKAHGKEIQEVHFHEVGAIDSIVDIVAAAVCFDNLKIDSVIVPSISEGSGSVRCQHGILPVPVPAVMNIATNYKLPIKLTKRKGELITPTGAAFVAAVMSEKNVPDVIVPKKIGIGAGKREYEQASMVRAILLDEEVESEYIWKIECNIDDSTGEELGYVAEKLMKKGARDVYYTPIFMKKNRPAWLLSVICDEQNMTYLEDIIFADTTTIGVRKQKMARRVLARKIVDVETKYGMVQVKVCENGGEKKYYPEYESVAKIAREGDISLRDIYIDAVKNAKED
ncbi:nickel pincer cofactor biosynthesis protein LarC [Eubacterium xylanophilum]|uniref:nickel pincer cofactor biosynthesis protein LarC n=1 Tax=Eubacterium xylanophilum TaxID=39497 RepID=UPI00047B56AF|nr:nickel pincer cofactor biosynthesis protein LarC [Eubacterium xylanophilum]